MGSIQARRDPTFEPIRVHEAFEREYPGGSRSATEVLLNITFTGVVAVNRVEEVLAPYGLVLKSFNVLAVLHGDSNPLTPTIIGERTLVAKSSVTSIVDNLEKLGMVRRSAHPVSRRSILVDLTAHGRSICTEILERLHEREARWVSGMPEPRRQSLIRLLGELRGLLSSE
jgi:DNA-binding MarR family transcriptional regulator